MALNDNMGEAGGTADAEIPRRDTEATSTRHRLTGFKWFVVIVAILSSTFLYALDNTVTANVRPSMIKTLGNRIDLLPWLSVAYPLGEIGTNPLWYANSYSFSSLF